MTYLLYKIKEVHMSTIQNDNGILNAIKERAFVYKKTKRLIGR